MERRTLGRSGPTLSVLGLGCNNFGMKIDQRASEAVIGAALDEGVTHLDTAEMYGGGKSEEFIGAAIAGRRDEVVIATKFTPRPKGEPFSPGALASRIREACEGSLERLATDRIDLYYQHYPDADAPLEEVFETLDALVTEGKVLHVAGSNWTADGVRSSVGLARERGLAQPVGLQIEWNLLDRGAEQSTVPAAREAGMGVIPYFPLASGLLTGKYRRGEAPPEGSRLDTMGGYFGSVLNDRNLDAVEALTAVAEDRGHTILELAVAWLAAQDGVASVIAGATTPDQVAANVRASGWQLTADDLAAVDGALASTT